MKHYLALFFLFFLLFLLAASAVNNAVFKVDNNYLRKENKLYRYENCLSNKISHYKQKARNYTL